MCYYMGGHKCVHTCTHMPVCRCMTMHVCTRRTLNKNPVGDTCSESSCLIRYCLYTGWYGSHITLASEGKAEGFLQPSNASVLPNGLETKVRIGGSVSKRRCSLSLVLEAGERRNYLLSTCSRARQPGLLPGG